MKATTLSAITVNFLMSLSGGLMMGFQWHRVEYQRRAHFAEIATKAAEETGLPVFAGGPSLF